MLLLALGFLLGLLSATKRVRSNSDEDDRDDIFDLVIQDMKRMRLDTNSFQAVLSDPESPSDAEFPKPQLPRADLEGLGMDTLLAMIAEEKLSLDLFEVYPLNVQLALCFTHPQQSPRLNLPNWMPPITQILGPKQIFSFEKAPYFDCIFKAYGLNTILEAIQKHESLGGRDLYSDQGYLHLEIMGNPTQTIDPLLWVKFRPLAESDQHIWTTFVSSRPNSQ